MTINYGLNRDIDPEGLFVGAGFIGTVPASAEVTFKNITFEDTKIVARERHVGCLVGRSLGGACTFENVTVRNFTVDGWCDYNNTSADTDGYPIAFRVAGIMGRLVGRRPHLHQCDRAEHQHFRLPQPCRHSGL